jgi:hypothetical protein
MLVQISPLGTSAAVIERGMPNTRLQRRLCGIGLIASTLLVLALDLPTDFQGHTHWANVIGAIAGLGMARNILRGVTRLPIARN